MLFNSRHPVFLIHPGKQGRTFRGKRAKRNALACREKNTNMDDKCKRQLTPHIWVRRKKNSCFVGHDRNRGRERGHMKARITQNVLACFNIDRPNDRDSQPMHLVLIILTERAASKHQLPWVQKFQANLAPTHK